MQKFIFKNLTVILILGIIINVFGIVWMAITIPNKLPNNPTSVEDTQVQLPEHFDYVYERFKVFNPDIDSTTVIIFNEVCKAYSLDTNDKLLELCVGQILLESGAKHYKGDKLLTSYAGAIGVGQIMPNTAYGILKDIPPEDAGLVLKLGSTPFYYKRYEENPNMRKFSKEWVSNEKNNIILWGYIMRTNLNKMNNIYKALVSYNSGTGGMNKYVRGGGNIYGHKYIRGITNKLNYVENNLSDHVE